MSRPVHAIDRRSALLGALAFTWSCVRLRGVAPAVGLACSLAPEQVEGPYYLDGARLRRDIREGKPGVPLTLALTVVDVRGCAPIEGAAVDVWHCDSGGVYSGFAAEAARAMPPPGPMSPDVPPGPHGPGFLGGPPPRARRSDALTFLRGVQLSDANGQLRFVTVYPGWYPGRSVHIHLRVRTEGALRGETYDGGHVAHTGQLYLPEDLSDRIFTLPAYTSHAGTRMRHDDDRIFIDGGEAGLVTVSPLELDSAASGFLANATVVLDPSSTPSVRR